MPGRNRGALPLALLIIAALAAGVVVAVMRLGDQKKMEQAGDGPSVTVSPTVPGTETPTTPPETPTSPPETPETPGATDTTQTPSPTTTETTETPSPKPTKTPSPKPTETPETPEPSPTETNGGGGPGNGDDDDDDILARTGGPVLPWFLGGVLMLAGSAGLWRLRRAPR